MHEVAGSRCDNDRSGLLLYIGAVAESVVKMLLRLGWVPLKTEIVEAEAKRWADRIKSERNEHSFFYLWQKTRCAKDATSPEGIIGTFLRRISSELEKA